MKSRIIRLFCTGSILLLLSLACNLPGADSSNLPEEEQTAIALTVAAELTKGAEKGETTPVSETPDLTLTQTHGSSTSTPSPSPTLTQTPTTNYTVTQTPIPCNQARFVTDVTFPDNTQVLAGSGFIKTWRLKNEGSCPWTSSYQVIFSSGDQMAGPNGVSLTQGSVGPNSTVDVSVNMTAPAAAGTYAGYWRLRAPDGTVFGIVNSPSGDFWAKIVSVNPTPQPSFTPTIQPPSLPDLIISDVTWAPDPPINGANTHVKVTVYNQGNAAATNFIVRWWGLESFANTSCQWPVANLVAHGGYVLECDFTFASPYSPLSTTAHVDDENSVAESDENNNKFKKIIDVN